MGRKRNRQDQEISTELGGFVVSAMYRVIELINNMRSVTESPDKPSAPPHSSRLETMLIDVFNLPEIRKVAHTLLIQMESKSLLKWTRLVKGFLAEMCGYMSDLYLTAGEEDPFQELTSFDCTYAVLDLLSYPYRLVDFALDIRGHLENILRRIVTGDPALLEEVRTLSTGLFSSSRDVIDVFNLVLLAAGGSQIEEATTELWQKMAADPTLMASVEFIEKERRWGGGPTDPGFGYAWQSMKPRIFYRIGKKGLLFPGARAFGDEEVFAMEAVACEMRRRVLEQPDKLLEDALAGKLSNSLVLSAERDIKDEIKKLRAKKRSIHIQTLLHGESGNNFMNNGLGEDRTSVDPSSFSTTPSPDIEEERWTDLVSCLTKEERTVIELRFEDDLNQEEVASRLGKSQPWVSKVLRSALNKMRKQAHVT